MILIPAWVEPYCLLMLISTLVRPSTTTEFSMGPASQPAKAGGFDEGDCLEAGIACRAR
ncbi:MAG: hypothetical protein MZV63_72540 [Marinilabiliales bacterium]|nr:hypothetical protein [Marinilabiliales bacterium]